MNKRGMIELLFSVLTRLLILDFKAKEINKSASINSFDGKLEKKYI